MSMPRDELWKVLVETVHALPMYKNHKRYVEESMLKEKPGISSQELAVQINITLGEAFVLLDEVRGHSADQKVEVERAGQTKTSGRTLLDFSANSS